MLAGVPFNPQIDREPDAPHAHVWTIVLTGDAAANAGNVSIDDQDVTGWSPPKRAAFVARVLKNIDGFDQVTRMSKLTFSV